MEDFTKLSEEYEDKVLALYYLNKLRDKFIKGYYNTVDKMSSRLINLNEQKNCTKLSYEFARFLAEIDKEIRSQENYKKPLQADTELIRIIKNNVVDKIIHSLFPIGSNGYHERGRLASILADEIERLLTIAYNIGIGRRDLTAEEIKEIDEQWMTKYCHNLSTAHTTSAKTLSALLSVCDNNPEMITKLFKN